MTSMRTSCVTRTFRPDRVTPNISKLSAAWSFFLANFMTSSSASYVGRIAAATEAEDAEEDEDRRAERSASVESETVMLFSALDCMR